MRGTCHIDGKRFSFGFFSVGDWICSVVLSFPAPWTVTPRHGKYYGTIIADSTGREIIEFWVQEGRPSIREIEYFGDGYSDGAWQECNTDCHWESETALSYAMTVVNERNDCGDFITDMPGWVRLIVDYGNWSDSAWTMVRCGGPLKRLLPWDKELDRHLSSMFRTDPGGKQ